MTAPTRRPYSAFHSGLSTGWLRQGPGRRVGAVMDYLSARQQHWCGSGSPNSTRRATTSGPACRC